MATDLTIEYNQEVLQNRSVFKLAVNKIRTAICRYLDYNNISYNRNKLWFRYIKIDSEHYILDIVDKSFKKNFINDIDSDDIRYNNGNGMSKRGALYHLLGGWHGDFYFFHCYCEENNLDVDNELINNVIPVPLVSVSSLSSSEYINRVRLPEGLEYFYDSNDLIEDYLSSENIDNIIYNQFTPIYKVIHKFLSIFTYILDKNKCPNGYIYEFNLIEEK